MKKTMQRCRSEALFYMKSRQSLQRLKFKSKQSIVAPLFSQSKTSSNQLNFVSQKQQNNSQNKGGTGINEKNRNLRIRNSQSYSKDKERHNGQSFLGKKLKSPLKHQKSEQKLKIKTEKVQQKPVPRQVTSHKFRADHFRQQKAKQALIIQKTQDFKSMIPQSGFIQGTEKIDKNYKPRNITISADGILVKNPMGWQFKTHQNYELQLKKVKRLTNLEFFKYFYKIRIFNKWKHLSRHVKRQNIIKYLSHTLGFNPNNITLVLKQQKILNNLTANHFIMNMDYECHSIEKDQYNAYLFDSISNRLKQIKLKSFEEFFMELILNLRKIIQDHEIFDKQATNFKLSDLAFEDYFIRKNIQDHEGILLKFIYRYQQIKIDIIFQLLEEVLSKIKYNIDKWNSNFKKFTLFDAINAEFSQAGSQEIDYACFSHQTKIKQIIIHVKANQDISAEDFRQISQNFVLKFIQQTKQYLREKYQSGSHCDNELAQLSKNLLIKKVISERQYTILDKCLKKIDTYCFAEHFKRINEDISIQIQRISEVIKQNLAIVVQAAKIIQNNFFNIINDVINTQISYKFQYCNYIQKLSQNVSKIPLKLKMGMYCLDLKASIEYYEAKIKKNCSIILNECLSVFQNMIKSIDQQITGLDNNINISSWSIRQFICSYNHCNDYNNFFENTLRESYKQLDSILMTIHRVQARYYEQSYLDLFHCKERSEIVRSKSLCFLREITYKLNYLATQKNKRVVNISSQINKIQMRILDLVTSQNIQFNYAYQVINAINEDLHTQGKQIQQLITFIDIQKSYIHKENKQIQFLTYQKLQNQVNLLLKLLTSYKDFHQFLNKQLERDYNSFRLELLVDCIHNQIAKIKQSIRFLHNYEKFLVNISSFYQADNTKVRLLRIIMQLKIEDLIKLDKRNFVMYEKYTAKQMVEYIKSQDKNLNTIKLFLEQKQYTNKIKEKIASIQTKITKFLLINSTQDFDEAIHPDLNNFIQMLQRNESQLQDFLKNEHLKQLKSQIYDFLSLLRKSIRFLVQYGNLFQLYTTYHSYLKKPNNQQRVINKFLNIFKEQSKQLTQICQKWWQLNIDIKQINLKSIIDHKYEIEIQRIYTLQSLIKIQMNKINQYLNRRIQQFPLFNLLPTSQLVKVINQPLLFLQYIHSTAKQVYWQHTQYSESSQKSSIVIKTIYQQKLIIPLQSNQSEKVKPKQDTQQNSQKKKVKLELQNCMQQISSMIKNSIINLITNSFQIFVELIFTQKLPLQVIFASDQINNYNLLANSKNVAEVISIIQKQMQMIISYKQKSQVSKYEMLLIDMLLISKMQFKSKVQNSNQSQIMQMAHLQKFDDQIYLNMNMDSIRLDYHLVDPLHYTIVEPINYRTFVKLYQTIIQIRSLFLFQPCGLQNVTARLMKHLFVVNEQKLSFQIAINLASKENILLYFRSNFNQTESEFFQKVGQAYNILNNALFQRQKKIKKKASSMRSLNLPKPILYIEIPVSIYQTYGRNMNDFQKFYKKLSVEQRLIFRIIQFYQPSIAILLKICLLRQNLNLDIDMECRILQELLIYKNNQQTLNNYSVNHQDFLCVIKNITKTLAIFEKIQYQNIQIAFKILQNQMSIDDIQKKNEKKKTIIFKNRALNGKGNQSILKWKQTKLNEQFIKFSKKMDQALEQQQCVMIVGKPCTGKSYMIKLYYQMVNLQIRNQRERGRIGGSRLMKLEVIDLSMIKFDPEYANSQLKLICKESEEKQRPSDFISLIWYDGISKLQNNVIQEILHKNWLIGLNNIDCRLVIQLSNMDNLSPRIALSYKQIIVQQKSYSFLQIIYANEQEIMYLLSDSILHKVIDPFTIFYKIFKDFFSIMKKITQKIFIIPYQQEMIAIHTFQLLIGIINHKSPKIVQQFETFKQQDKMQALRKLFAFCFLWITSSLVEEAYYKKFEQAFLQLCKKQRIDIQNIGSNYIINHKSDIIEYIPLKNAKNILLKAQQPTLINNSSIFIHTYQTIILSNFLLFTTCNSVSKIMLFGQNQTGKTAILQNFTTQSKAYRHFYYICSFYTYNCLRDFNKSLKEMNSVYERQKIQQMLKQQKGKQMKWCMKLAKTKCVFVENVGMELWKPALGYFKYISSMEKILVDGQIFEFRNLHLLLERNGGHHYTPEEQHFLRIKINYEQRYFSQVFYGIYELIGKNCSVNNQTCYDILKIKGAIVKNLLLLMKMIQKKIKHSIKSWTYFYHLSTLKHIMQELKNKQFRSKGQFLQGLFQEVQFQLYRRMKDEGSKVTLYKLLENCRQHIKQDLRQDFILQEPSYLRSKEQEIIQKLTNYLQYKNQFKNLNKSKTLISNLTQFYGALNKKPLIILNCCSIPGVGSFLPVAVQILGLQLIQISNLQQLKLITSESQRSSMICKSEDITLYYIPSWVVKNQEVLAFLSNKIRNLEYNVRVRRNKSLSEILGTNSNQNKCFFIIEYSNKLQQKQLNILRYNYLMKSATFLQLQQPVRNEQLLELSQFLGKEREELNVKQNETIMNKIKKIYQIFENEQIFKKMNPSIYQYLFSIENYFRFIKIIIDTYFQRKYEIKSNLNQIQLSIARLEDFIQQYKAIKAKNNQTKILYNERKKRISSLNQSYHSMNDYMMQLVNNHKYRQLKQKKGKILQYGKTKQKMLHKQQVLLDKIQNFSSVPRMQIANLKSLYNNNQSFMKGLFQSLALLICDNDDHASIKRAILDINLNLRIKEINLQEKKEQIVRAVEQKMSTLQLEDYKVCYNLVNWLKYSIQYYNFKKDLQETLSTISKVHVEAFQNIQAIQIQAKIQKVNVEIDENRDRLQKQKTQFKQIQLQLKQSDTLLKGLTRFNQIDNFKDKCQKQRETLLQEYKLCLQSSIYFSINLNFIFPSDAYSGVQISKGKDKYDSYRALMEKIFVRWSAESSKQVQLSFFNQQIYRIFENKQKYQLIDKQLDSQDPNLVIAKCKKIGNLNCCFIDPHNQDNKDIDLFIPQNTYNKLLYISYVLSIRYNTNSILIIDHFSSIYKYLNINYTHKLTLKPNARKYEANKQWQDSQQAYAYVLKQHQSAILDTNHTVLFVQIPVSAQQISFSQNRRQVNGMGGYLLKINFCQFLVPFYQNLKVIFICRKVLVDSDVMQQFYCIHFEENYQDGLELINHQILKYHMNKMNGSLGLLNCMKQSTNVVLSESQIKKLIVSLKKQRLDFYLQMKQKWLIFEIIEKCCAGQSHQKMSINNSLFFNNILLMIDQWRAVSKEVIQININILAIKSYCHRVINSYSELFLQIYRICLNANAKIGGQNCDHNHESFTYFIKLVREGLKFLLLTEQQSPIEKQLPLLEKFLLKHYCSLSLHRDAYTTSLYVRLYSLRTDVANSFELPNLFAQYNYQNFLEALSDQRVDSLAHAAHLQLPIYKIQIEKMLKSLREIRADKIQGIKLRAKNLVLCPAHISELISNFEFKLVRKDSQGTQQTFNKLSLFTQLLLQKWLTPSLFTHSCWSVANQWREQEIKLDIHQNILMHTCFLFCDVRYWSRQFQQIAHKNVQLIRLQDNNKLRDYLPQENEDKLYVIIDQRDLEERNDAIIRQKLQEYLSINRGGLVVLLSQKFHTAFHDLLREMYRSNDLDTVEVHCLQIYQLLQLLSKFKQKQNVNDISHKQIYRSERKSKVGIIEEKSIQLFSKWSIFKNKTLKNYPNEVERTLIMPVISQIENQIIAINKTITPKSLRAAAAKLSIWQYYSYYQLQNHNFGFNETEMDLTPKFQSFPIEIIIPEQHTSSKGLQNLMNGLIKNRMAINGFLRNRLNSRYKEIPQNPTLATKVKAKAPVVAQEIEIRYAFTDFQEKGEPNMIDDFRNSGRRSSKKKNTKCRNSSISRPQQDYQIESFLQAKGKKLMNELQVAIDRLLTLWRTYQGERTLVIDQQEMRRAVAGKNFQEFFQQSYQLIVQRVLQIEQLGAIKEYKRPEILFKEEDLGLFLGQVRESSVLLLSPHCVDRRECEAVLKCYEVERCQQCLFLGKRKNSERVCFLINQKIYELAYQNLSLKKQVKVPYITIQTGFDVLQAKIYCKRILSLMM